MSLPNTLHLHFPARMYLSASSHSSSGCVVLLQNLHHSTRLCVVLGSAVRDSVVCWVEMIASRLVLITSASASSAVVVRSVCAGCGAETSGNEWISGSSICISVGDAGIGAEGGEMSCRASTRDVACCHSGAFVAVARFDYAGEGDCKTRGNTCSVGSGGCSGAGVAGGDIEGAGNTVKGVCGACARGA